MEIDQKVQTVSETQEVRSNRKSTSNGESTDECSMDKDMYSQKECREEGEREDGHLPIN